MGGLLQEFYQFREETAKNTADLESLIKERDVFYDKEFDKHHGRLGRHRKDLEALRTVAKKHAADMGEYLELGTKTWDKVEEMEGKLCICWNPEKGTEQSPIDVDEDLEYAGTEEYVTPPLSQSPIPNSCECDPSSMPGLVEESVPVVPAPGSDKENDRPVRRDAVLVPIEELHESDSQSGEDQGEVEDSADKLVGQRAIRSAGRIKTHRRSVRYNPHVMSTSSGAISRSYVPGRRGLKPLGRKGVCVRGDEGHFADDTGDEGSDEPPRGSDGDAPESAGAGLWTFARPAGGDVLPGRFLHFGP